MAYAVIDFETTGILPSHHHRVVELGLTHVDGDGTITGHWETLINPERDLGPQAIHGIRAADILDAPVFSDIAADLADLLRGRVVVAHNAPFDVRFLVAEFQRAGYWITDALPHVCTMRLGSQFGLGGSTSLAHACTHYAIENTRAHSAGADAHATARLLGIYLQATAGAPGWGDYWGSYVTAARTFPYPTGRTTGVVWRSRAEAEAEPVTHFLERIAAEVSLADVEGADAEYLALLDRCLLDRLVSVSEAQQLAEVAGELGLARSRVIELHEQYFRALANVAWADGVLTDEERADLDAVADLLRIDDGVRAGAMHPAGSAPDDALDAPASFVLEPGDMIVLTGEMSRPR